MDFGQKWQAQAKISELCGIEVWRGVWAGYGSVFVKIFDPEAFAEWDLGLLEHEFQILTEFSDIAGLKPLHLEIIDGRTYAIYRWVECSDLESFLNTEELSWEQRLDLCLKLLDTIETLHAKKWVHRALMPSFLAVDRESSQPIFLHLFFAVSQHYVPAWNSDIPWPEAARAYRAPEQKHSYEQEPDAITDIYALGMIFYRILGDSPALAMIEDRSSQDQQGLTVKPLPQLIADFPLTLWHIVQKMLAPIPGARYLSVRSVRHDLKLFLERWRLGHTDPLFRVGQAEIALHLSLPTRLYGKAEIQEGIQSAVSRFFDGEPCLLFLKGPAHSGKAFLMKELWSPLSQNRGQVLHACYEKQRVEWPFEALRETLDLHIQGLLQRPKSEKQYWQQKILQACEPFSDLLIQLWPRLVELIGRPQVGMDLPTVQQAVHFELALKTFLRVLCEPHYPLVLLLDHIERMDAASARLLHSLVLRDPVPYLFLIAAYDEQAEATEAFRELVEKARTCLGFHELSVQKLKSADIEDSVADIVGWRSEMTETFAQWLFDQTEGDPGQLRKCLESLEVKRMLRYDGGKRQWHIDRVELEKKPLCKFPREAQSELDSLPECLEILQFAAVLGNRFDAAELEAAGLSQVAERMERCIQESWISPLRETDYRRYRYRKQAHCPLAFRQKGLRDFLLSGMAPETLASYYRKAIEVTELGRIPEVERDVFDRTRYLLKGRDRVHAPLSLSAAQLILRQVQRVRRLGDYELSLLWNEALAEQLRGDASDPIRRVLADLDNERMRAAFMLGDYAQQQETVRTLMQEYADPLVALESQKLLLESELSRNMYQGLRFGLQLTRRLGLALPEHVGVWRLMGLGLTCLWKARPMKVLDEELRGTQPLSQGHWEDPPLKEAFTLGARLASAASMVEPYLADYISLRALLEIPKQARHELYPLACIHIASQLAARGGSLNFARELSRKALRLAQREPDSWTALRAEYLHQSYLCPWFEPVHWSRKQLLILYRKALKIGDYEYACHCYNHASVQSFYAGQNLEQFGAESLAEGRILNELQQVSLQPYRLILMEAAAVLRGETAHEVRLEGSFFKESQHSHLIEHIPDFAAAFHTVKMLLAWFADQPQLAAEHARHAEKYRSAVVGSWLTASISFYQGLIAAQELRKASVRQKLFWLRLLLRSRRQYRRWAQVTPLQAKHRWLCLEAEWVLLRGASEQALNLFHQAQRAAAESDFYHDQALICERICSLYKALGWEASVWPMAAQAHQCYTHWGALRKAQRVLAGLPVRGPIHSVLKADQLEISQEYPSVRQMIAEMAAETDETQIYRMLLAAAAQIGGAPRSVLLLRDRSTRLWKTYARWEQGQLEVLEAQDAEDPRRISWTLLTAAERLRAKMIFEDASLEQSLVPGLEKDPYMLRFRVRSLLCLPILSGDRETLDLLGVLQLENSHASHMFHPRKVELLELLVHIAAGRIELSEKAGSLSASFREVRQVQSALLPTQKTSPTFSISHYYRPAEISGGDWFSYFEDEAHKQLFLFIGDVTGHGVPSSLITGAAAGAVYSCLYTIQEAKGGGDLAETLELLVKAVNRTVLETAARVGRMMTMNFVGLNTETGEGVLLSAGHPPCFIVGSEGVKGLRTSGSPLGHSVDGQWRLKSFQLQRGDSLFLYTDGLIENQGPSGERLSLRQLEKKLEEKLSPRELRRKILQETFELWKDQKLEDDVTFLIVRWNEKKVETRPLSASKGAS